MEQTPTSSPEDLSYRKQHFRIFGKWRSRHPTAARIGRNLAITAAIVAPLGLGSRHYLRAARALNASRKRIGPLVKTRRIIKLNKRAKILRTLAYGIGIPATVISVANPLERAGYEKRRLREAMNRPTLTTQVHVRNKPHLYRELYS